MNKYLRKTIKVFKIAAIVLLLLFISAAILIRFPAVQNWLVQKITVTLTETLQTKVVVQKGRSRFF